MATFLKFHLEAFQEGVQAAFTKEGLHPLSWAGRAAGTGSTTGFKILDSIWSQAGGLETGYRIQATTTVEILESAPGLETGYRLQLLYPILTRTPDRIQFSELEAGPEEIFYLSTC